MTIINSNLGVRHFQTNERSNLQNESRHKTFQDKKQNSTTLTPVSQVKKFHFPVLIQAAQLLHH
jgi:hypothetical protein